MQIEIKNYKYTYLCVKYRLDNYLHSMLYVFTLAVDTLFSALKTHESEFRFRMLERNPTEFRNTGKIIYNVNSIL